MHAHWHVPPVLAAATGSHAAAPMAQASAAQQHPARRQQHSCTNRLLEVAQHFVATLHRTVERLLGALLARQRLLAFFLDDGAYFRHPPQMEAARIVGYLAAGKLFDRHIGTGVLLEPSLLR